MPHRLCPAVWEGAKNPEWSSPFACSPMPMMGKLKTTIAIRGRQGGKVVAGSIFCCNGTKIDLLSISVGFLSVVIPFSI